MTVTTFRSCRRHDAVVVVVVDDAAAGADRDSVLLRLRPDAVRVVVLVDPVVKSVGRLRMDLVVLSGAVMPVRRVRDLGRVRKLRLAAQVVQGSDLVPQDPADGGH